ncbi:MAG: 30S ribosomal protein S20 [Armatimonadetes bacterium]|nr:30S ribosomal protein S20 [Armatimonadota bacterium]MBS1712406.1 30S ribosomal protein S20 [Armatimonadota bacterium]MBX3109285.1 30S ribosomal protein S20 [Fimbriimonadaceae bacterium]
MANLKSSKKDVKRSSKKAAVNKSVKTSLKTYVKKVRLAVDGGDQKAVSEALALAVKNIDKAAQRGIIHKNQASRRKSRAAKAANAVAK